MAWCDFETIGGWCFIDYARSFDEGCMFGDSDGVYNTLGGMISCNFMWFIELLQH